MNIEDLSVKEMKAILFDLEQEVKFKSQKFNQLMKILEEKILNEKSKEESNDKPKRK